MRVCRTCRGSGVFDSGIAGGDFIRSPAVKMFVTRTSVVNSGDKWSSRREADRLCGPTRILPSDPLSPVDVAPPPNNTAIKKKNLGIWVHNGPPALLQPDRLPPTGCRHGSHAVFPSLKADARSVRKEQDYLIKQSSVCGSPCGVRDGGDVHGWLEDGCELRSDVDKPALL